MMYRAQTSFSKSGKASEPYYTDGIGRKWTEAQLYFVDPVEAAALRQAAATNTARPTITSYAYDRPIKPSLRGVDTTDRILLPSVEKRAPVTTTRQLKEYATASTAAGVVSRSKAKKADALTGKIQTQIDTFEKKWQGAGQLTAAQALTYTKEKQALDKRTAPMMAERQKLIGGSLGFYQKAVDYKERYETGKIDAIPLIAKEQARKTRLTSVYEAKKLAEPSTSGEVFETVGRGVVGGAGFGLALAGGGFAPWSPVTVAGGALSGGIAGAGYEAGKTLTSVAFKAVPEQFITARTMPKLDTGEGSFAVKIPRWIGRAEKPRPTLEQFYEAQLRGEKTYADFEVYDPRIVVTGAQIGVGLLASVASVEGAGRIAAFGAPKLAAFRGQIRARADVKSDIVFEKHTQLAKGTTKAEITLEGKQGKVLSHEKIGIERTDRFKTFAESADKTWSATKSDIITTRPGKIPKTSEWTRGTQYDLSHYLAEGKGATTDVIMQTGSVGGGKPRVSEAAIRIYQVGPDQYIGKATGVVKPVSPFQPKVDVTAEFRIHGVTTTKPIDTGVFHSPTSAWPMKPPSQVVPLVRPPEAPIAKSLFDPAGAFKAGLAPKVPPSSSASFSGFSSTQQQSIIEEMSVALNIPPGTSYSSIPPGAFTPPGIQTIEGAGVLYQLSEAITEPRAPPETPTKKRYEPSKLTHETRPELRSITAVESTVTGIKSPTERILFARPVSAVAIMTDKVKGVGQPTPPIQTPIQDVGAITIQETKPISIQKTIVTPVVPIITIPVGPGPITPSPPITPITPLIPPLFPVTDPGAYGGSQGWGGGFIRKTQPGKKSKLQPTFTLMDVFRIEATTGREARHPTGKRAEAAFERSLATASDFTELSFFGKETKRKKKKKKTAWSLF